MQGRLEKGKERLDIWRPTYPWLLHLLLLLLLLLGVVWLHRSRRSRLLRPSLWLLRLLLLHTLLGPSCGWLGRGWRGLLLCCLHRLLLLPGLLLLLLLLLLPGLLRAKLLRGLRRGLLRGSLPGRLGGLRSGEGTPCLLLGTWGRRVVVW